MSVGEVKHVENAYYLYKKEENKYLLMNGWAPYRGCPIYYVKPEEGRYHSEERQTYNRKAHFYDRCDGTIWELTGKLVSWTAYHKERDMECREFEINTDNYILFDKSKT